MKDSFGLTRGSRGVEDKQRVFRLKSFRFVVGHHRCHFLVPPQVTAPDPAHLISTALHHKHGGHCCLSILESLVHRRFEWEHGAFTVTTIRGNHHGGLGVINASPQALGAKPSEDHGVDGS